MSEKKTPTTAAGTTTTATPALSRFNSYATPARKTNKRVIIIGAGAGGTALAARLARRGHSVTVLEKNSFGGGRCSLIHHEGHRFDQGPSLYLMPEIFEACLRIYTTLYDRTTKYFKSRHVRRALTFSAMYMGMSPFDAPATYSLLQYAEYAKGIWYPIGGFYKVVEAMENIARDKFGAEFRYDTGVKKIVVDESKGKVKGVELESGEVLEADVVVSNADLVWTYNNLLPSSSYAQKLNGKDQTCSSISFYWSLSEVVEELGGHNIFLADAYQESFDEIFRDGDTPTEPSFYVNVPSRLDPSAAPPGKDSLVILVPCGPISIPEKPCTDPAKGARTREQFAKTVSRARTQVIETLSKRLNRPDFKSLIIHEIINDPFDWQEKFNLFRGSILGLSHTIPQEQVSPS
ncbi:hypothetical protein NDA16_002845 [Ustilago loliicola]|nr:hypothetical protein NDA16_002845 [Ustilago loliicola]